MLNYPAKDAKQKYHTDGITVVDLTAAFGAGKEPTKVWRDENIDYFDGTYMFAY